MLLDTGCVVCGDSVGPVCSVCVDALVPADPLTIDGVDVCRVGFTLDDRTKTIIAALKYKRQRRLAKWLAREIIELVPRCADLITWVPATPERRRSRGFDHAEELGAALGNHSGVPVGPTLTRAASDQRQTGQPRSARLAGPTLESTSTCPPFVVLVDDVITTGSSMRVAASALRHAGAERIVAVAIAATPLVRDLCLRRLTNRCSVHEWT